MSAVESVPADEEDEEDDDGFVEDGDEDFHMVTASMVQDKLTSKVDEMKAPAPDAKHAEAKDKQADAQTMV